MKRRDFFKTAGVVAGIGLLNTDGADAADAKSPTIKKYGTLGRTGLKISDISFGTGKLDSASLVARAVDMGVNYFDTAPDYGKAEETLGDYIKKSGNRDKMIIASKFCTKGPYPAHLDADAKEQEYIDAVEASLKRMNTDHMDIVFVHAIGEDGRKFEERLLAENMLNAFAKLKKAGKTRFLAVSSHGPNRESELLTKAVKSGHYDVIMPAYNFMKNPNLPQVIKVAGENNVGVVAMKALAGAKDISLDPKSEKFSHAAFKYVLKSPQVAGLVITVKNAQDLMEYVEASGQPFTEKSRNTLDQYAMAYSKEYCRTGCGDCIGACPENVNIPFTLRQYMYFADYGDEKRAMQNYSRLEPKADCCANCATPSCDNACSYGIPVSRMMAKAHEDLTFA